MGFEDEDASVVIRVLEIGERPPNLPEQIDQVWECTCGDEKFGYIYTSVYGWTNSREVMRDPSPEFWAHWQDQDAALYRLLDELERAGELPQALVKERNDFYIKMLIGDEDEALEEEEQEEGEEGNIFTEIARICNQEAAGVQQFAEDGKIPTQTVLMFINSIKRQIAELVVIVMAEEDEIEDEEWS